MSTAPIRHARGQHPLPTPARRRAWVRPVVAGAALLVGVGLGGGGTFALWGDGPGNVAGATIRTGDLEVSLVGTPVWTQTSADVADKVNPIDPAQFLVRPGDTFSITQSATVLVRGDNLNATFAVTFPGAVIPVGENATYTVLDGARELGSADVGSPVTIPAIVGSSAGVTRNLTIRVDLAFAANGPREFGTPGSANDVVAANLGSFTVTLSQVRSGGGFS